jgi:hypothetical protein
MLGNLHQFNAPPSPHDVIERVSGSLTVRDYFAASALEKLFVFEEEGFSELDIAKIAYTYADAMMEARK